MKYFLIGIKGVSMSGIAKILKAQGHQVIGSDLKTGGHSRNNITPELDAVIYTSAALPGSPAEVEVQRARELKIPLYKRSEFIGKLLPGKKIIAVTGTHGKTTIASMISEILRAAKFDPSILIGADPTNKVESAALGSGDYFVVEACEYDRSFLDFSCEIGVISNIELEHLDYYKGGMPEIIDSFGQFITLVGKTLVAGEGVEIDKAIKRAQSKPLSIQRYGNDSAFNQSELRLQVGAYGEHNILNALAAYAVARELGIENATIRLALKNFYGAKRRLEEIFRTKETVVIDDYGHHPTEIKASLKAISEEYPSKPLKVVFQPHQASRLKELFSDFTESFENADEVVVLPVYQVPGRDEPIIKSSQDLVNELNRKNIKASQVGNYQLAIDYLTPSLGENQVILTLGATDVYTVAEGLKNA